MTGHYFSVCLFGTTKHARKHLHPRVISYFELCYFFPPPGKLHFIYCFITTKYCIATGLRDREPGFLEITGNGTFYKKNWEREHFREYQLLGRQGKGGLEMGVRYHRDFATSKCFFCYFFYCSDFFFSPSFQSCLYTWLLFLPDALVLCMGGACPSRRVFARDGVG